MRPLEGSSNLVVWVMLLFPFAFGLAASLLRLRRAALPLSAVMTFDFV